MSYNLIRQLAFEKKPMFYRTFCTLILTVLLLGAMSGCDNRPKIVMPTGPVPPAPRPALAGGGPAQPAAPQTEPKEKPADPKEPPADSTPQENKQERS